MNREIKHPYWANDEKTQVVCQFHYENGQVLEASVMDTEEGNPDWAEIFETFTVEDLDETTNRMLEEREEIKQKQRLQDDEQKERFKTDTLFAAKLEAFEIPAIRNSKNRKLKSSIRKAQTLMEVQAYTTILLMEELKNEESND